MSQETCYNSSTRPLDQNEKQTKKTKQSKGILLSCFRDTLTSWLISLFFEMQFAISAYLPSTRYDILSGLHDYGKLLDFYQSVSTLLYQKYIVKWMFQYALHIVLNEPVDFTAVSLISTLY